MILNIRVQKEGEERLLSIPEFEAATGAVFLSQLLFADASVSQNIREKIRILHQKGELSPEQLWLGSYYRREIQTASFPEVVVRWIDNFIGWGVFAAKPFKKGEFIAEYCGIVRKRQRKDRHNAYGFEYALTPQISTPYIIDAQDQGGVGRLINHCDQPNLRSTLVTLDGINHVVLIAALPIQNGAQLVYDYGPDYWSSRTKPKDLDVRKKAG